MNRMLGERISMRMLLFAALVTLALGAAPAMGQDAAEAPAPAFEQRAVDIWSDGTRISGDFFTPAGAEPGQTFPTVVLCHGWGGIRSHLNAAYAPRFAAAGFNVLTFDYRGWGDSDSRLVLRETQPEADENGEATARVQLIREVVDPVDQLEDIRSALNFLEGEPAVDPARIGLWGTSYGGGHVVWMAAHDPRPKAIVAQVGSMNSTLAIQARFADEGGLEYADSLAVRRARGEIDPVPQNEPIARGLRGTPIVEKVAHYRPVDFADKLNAPTLIIDVGKEELFDIRENGRKVYDLVKDRIPAKYHVFEEITHYQIYAGEPLREATQLAIDWFSEHL
jgi:uncharacterized protein